MKKFDYLSLDARALQVLIAVYETRSVTKASERIGLTQSAVSHTLDKLRHITGNPLFVRRPGGVTPTGETERVIDQARELLAGLRRLAKPAPFSPAEFSGIFTLGVTDYELQLFVPELYRRLRRQAPQARLALVSEPSLIEAEHLLSRFDLVFSPYFSAQAGVYRAPLLSDQWLSFYDPEQRPAPTTLETFLAAEHAVVVLGDHPRTALDDRLAAEGQRRQVSLQVPSFAMLPALLRGTDLIVTVLGGFRGGLLRDFAAVPCPLSMPPFELNMLWHSRVHHDPAQRWLRALALAVARGDDSEAQRDTLG